MSSTKSSSYDRTTLFNLDQSISVSRDEFDNSIWPLISNVWTQLNNYGPSASNTITHTFDCRLKKHRQSSTRKEDDDTPDHSHSLEDCDSVKRPKAVTRIIQVEAAKAYKPPAIVDAVKELIVDQGFEELAPHLRRKEVANIQASVRTSQLNSMIGDENLEKDFQDAITRLTKEDYFVESFNTKNSYRGVSLQADGS
ncbi:hypothetical protein BGZ76_000992 [Entomortierella beljakovae]|nr:hypothetical protein BGZ76_000992 [Entomortierella beljakovae]